MSKRRSQVFDSNQRIRLGVWGLGRGLNFYATCKSLNIDVVALPGKQHLAGSGNAPKFEVKLEHDRWGKLTANTGHGGGDFWVLYYFARQIFIGEPAPFDIYAACDVTIPGILAYRSSLEDGQPYAVPDFRNADERKRYRHDHWHQKAYDYKKAIFPIGADYSLTQRFSKTASELVHYATLYRAYADWRKVRLNMAEPYQLLGLMIPLLEEIAPMRKVYLLARKIISAYPRSDGARVLGELLELGEESVVMAPAFLAQLKREWRRLVRLAGRLSALRVSRLLPLDGSFQAVGLPPKGAGFRKQGLQLLAGRCFLGASRLNTFRQSGLIYIECFVQSLRSAKAMLRYGAYGSVKLWLNHREIACQASIAGKSLNMLDYQAQANWRRGQNKLIFALQIDGSSAWGVTLSLAA